MDIRDSWMPWFLDPLDPISRIQKLSFWKFGLLKVSIFFQSVCSRHEDTHTHRCTHTCTHTHTHPHTFISSLSLQKMERRKLLEGIGSSGYRERICYIKREQEDRSKKNSPVRDTSDKYNDHVVLVVCIVVVNWIAYIFFFLVCDGITSILEYNSDRLVLAALSLSSYDSLQMGNLEHFELEPWFFEWKYILIIRFSNQIKSNGLFPPF